MNSISGFNTKVGMTVIVDTVLSKITNGVCDMSFGRSSIANLDVAFISVSGVTSMVADSEGLETWSTQHLRGD